MSKCKIIVKNENDTIRFIDSIIEDIKPNDVICLFGDLGTGKTFITKQICKKFRVDDEITSPTFNLVKTYNVHNKKINKINHFDLYRINNIIELENIGFFDYLYDTNSINIIEWPEIAIQYIENRKLLIYLTKLKDNNSRCIIYEK